MPHEESLTERLCGKGFSNSYHLSLKEVYYADIDDFSFWNIPCNVRLSSMLVLKSMSPGAGLDWSIYNVTTPNSNGLLEIQRGTINLATYHFTPRKNTIEIMFYGVQESHMEKVKNIIASARPLSEANTRGRRAVSNNHKYPRELELISDISINGKNRENLTELLSSMKSKNYTMNIINTVQLELDSLPPSLPSPRAPQAP